eukprot:3477830-Pleurochrysis_carterae.AAC.2
MIRSTSCAKACKFVQELAFSRRCTRTHVDNALPVAPSAGSVRPMVSGPRCSTITQMMNTGYLYRCSCRGARRRASQKCAGVTTCHAHVPSERKRERQCASDKQMCGGKTVCRCAQSNASFARQYEGISVFVQSSLHVQQKWADASKQAFEAADASARGHSFMYVAEALHHTRRAAVHMLCAAIRRCELAPRSTKRTHRCLG